MLNSSFNHGNKCVFATELHYVCWLKYRKGNDVGRNKHKQRYMCIIKYTHFDTERTIIEIIELFETPTSFSFIVQGSVR